MGPYHLVHAFEVSPPRFLATVFTLGMPPSLYHILEVAHDCPQGAGMAERVAVVVVLVK